MIDLSATLTLELKLNWFLLNNPPLPERDVYHPQYYDPTRQVFKFRDDAITYHAQLPGFAEGHLETALALLTVSQNVRFVNLQIDELLAFRFGDPVMYASSLAYIRKRSELLRSPKLIHESHRAWFAALAQRHWAIVNEGLYKRLKPSLEALLPGERV